jgi:ABC-type multidrug transport system ATPase subunit
VREPIAARSLVGYVPQRPAFGDATAEETLRFVARLRRVPEDRIAPALRRVGLEPGLRARTRTFSGGMQQRLSLAAALLADPAVLLLDEPTASLDRQGQREFLDLAAGLRSEGRTLLLASHRAEEIERLADRVIELCEGRVVEQGVRLLRAVP